MKAEIKFKIKAYTQMHQSIRLLGDIEALGSWNPTQSIQLFTNEKFYPYWFNLHFIRVPMGN